MDEKALQLLNTFARAAKDLPRRTHWTEFNAFIIHVHQCRLSITTAEITERLLACDFTLEDARRLSLVFLQGSEVLLQYDKHVMA